jgi:hypothetical protein
MLSPPPLLADTAAAAQAGETGRPRAVAVAAAEDMVN